MYTLLIYEMVPEELFIYLIPNEVITERDRAFLNQAHRNMMNGRDEEEIAKACHFVSAAIADPAFKEDFLDFANDVGRFGQYNVHDSGDVSDTGASIVIGDQVVPNVQITSIVCTGMFL